MADLENEKAFLAGLSKQANPKVLRQGMRSLEVIILFGQPEKVDVKQLRTKKTETYKYCKRGRTYLLKVTLDDGVVVAWEDRR